MVKLEDAVIARYEHAGERFELLVDPNLAMELKHGGKVAIEDLLVIDSVFKDAHKGDVKSEERIKAVFGTSDLKTVVERIVREGEVQLTTQQRREMLEKRKAEVIQFIARNAVNPQTQAPHPPQRIALAMEEARIQVDLNKSSQEQVPGILKEIRRLIPISMEQLRVAVRVPALYAGKATAVLHKYDLKKEEWQNDGSLIALVEVPAGLKQDLFNELNHLTHGSVESKLVETK
ncbi:MAG TPA: ribosome assembly factor SBDS [Candidatus Diapherotrites archaeon]|uniref:Ribosome assembly factor SBDS n=1 Tax=Candidatus Iainarchaeum sp. TaxID=3101447 RepID=A0A7J4JHM2_9ARCH|nr:ribosome assembly factor SBDS [Candidatus Diapherotrites archaeon]HIH16079.1 ribosome assembly factor SBDS [Candidatus Diapherotrites archaeon]